MLDAPTGPDLLQAVARLLRDTLLPQLPAEAAFQARVAANALDLAAREWQQAPAAEAADRARMAALLAHLWAGTLARLAIDQPAYAPYRDEIHRDEIAPKE